MLSYHLKKYKVWNKRLCEADSDSDGWTNGEELGDPKCLWREGMQDPVAAFISHPGSHCCFLFLKLSIIIWLHLICIFIFK